MKLYCPYCGKYDGDANELECEMEDVEKEILHCEECNSHFKIQVKEVTYQGGQWY